MASADELLKGIVQGDIKRVANELPVVVTAPKIRNDVLRNMVTIYQEKGLLPETIIKKLLAFDEATEKGLINEEKLKSLKERPEDIKKIFNFAS